jgi:hypothetical protein
MHMIRYYICFGNCIPTFGYPWKCPLVCNKNTITIKGVHLSSSFVISYVYFTSLNIMAKPKQQIVAKLNDLK